MEIKEQVAIPMRPQVIRSPVEIDYELLKPLRSWRDAVRVGIKLSNTVDSYSDLAEKMNMNKSYFSEIINKKNSKPRYFDFDRLPELEMYLGNKAVSQFIELQSNQQLYCQRKSYDLTVEEKAALWDQQQLA